MRILFPLGPELGLASAFSADFQCIEFQSWRSLRENLMHASPLSNRETEAQRINGMRKIPTRVKVAELEAQGIFISGVSSYIHSFH